MDQVTTVDEIPEQGSFLFTVEELSGRQEEIILVRATDGVSGWKNFCMHEPDQRLDRGMSNGAVIRDGEIICPRHGSMFHTSTGQCNNGPAASQSLVEVDVTIHHGTVFLTDDSLTFLHEGGIEDDDGTPASTSHISF